MVVPIKENIFILNKVKKSRGLNLKLFNRQTCFPSSLNMMWKKGQSCRASPSWTVEDMGRERELVLHKVLLLQLRGGGRIPKDCQRVY